MTPEIKKLIDGILTAARARAGRDPTLQEAQAMAGEITQGVSSDFAGYVKAAVSVAVLENMGVQS